MKKRAIFAAALLVLAAMPACTNDEGETEAPVFITVSLELQPGFVNIGAPAPVQVQEIELQSRLKNANQSDPQGFADTQINSYTVRFRRTDGGTRVPATKTYGAGILVPAGGTATLANFPIMDAGDLQQSPFDQLLPFNGGVDRETGRQQINLTFDITFFGRTVSGHRVQSETASGLLLFTCDGCF
ncbi:MAG: hypothetical protein ABI610_04030 [Acidobacteriota bacterium]